MKSYQNQSPLSDTLTCGPAIVHFRFIVKQRKITQNNFSRLWQIAYFGIRIPPSKSKMVAIYTRFFVVFDECLKIGYLLFQMECDTYSLVDVPLPNWILHHRQRLNSYFRFCRTFSRLDFKYYISNKKTDLLLLNTSASLRLRQQFVFFDTPVTRMQATSLYGEVRSVSVRSG